MIMRFVLIFGICLAFASTGSAQVVKGTAVWYFDSIPNIAANVAAKGTELAYSISLRKLYRWNRVTSQWSELTSYNMSVYDLDELSDTTTITAPQEGDIIVTPSILLVRDGTMWLQFQGGDDWGDQVVHKDSTLRGDGTSGDPLRVNRDSFLTAAIIEDSLAAVREDILPTDLSFSGATSPVTLQSSTGTDVSFLAGTGMGFSQTGNQLTLNNTGVTGSTAATTYLPKWSSSTVLTGDSRYRFNDAYPALEIYGSYNSNTTMIRIASGGANPLIQSTTANNGLLMQLGGNGSLYVQNTTGTDRFGINGGSSTAYFPTSLLVGGSSTYPARLTTRGSGTTSATYSFIAENSSGTDALTVRDDGNVGVGSGAPISRFHVDQSGNGAYPFQYITNYTNNTAVRSGIVIETDAVYGATNHRGTGYQQFSKAYTGATWGGTFAAGNAMWALSANDTINNFMSQVINAPGSNVASYRGGFRWLITNDPNTLTTSNELMRLTKGGLGLGTSNASAKLHVVGDFKLTSRTGTATAIGGWDSNNKSTDITKGNGLTLVAGTLDVNRDSFPTYNIFTRDGTFTGNRIGTIPENNSLLFQSTNSESGAPYQYYIGTVNDDIYFGDYAFGRYSLTGDATNWLMEFDGYSYDDAGNIKVISANDGSSNTVMLLKPDGFQIQSQTGIGETKLWLTDSGIIQIEGENGIEFNSTTVTPMMTLNTDAARLESSLVLVNDASDLSEDGQLWKAENRLNFNTGDLSTALPGVMFTGTSDVTVSNTVTETTLIPTGVGTVTIPAGFLKVGKTFTVEAWGIYTADASPSTLELKATLGGVLLCTTGANTMTTTEGGQWHTTMTFTCRTTGVMSQGETRFSPAVDANTTYWMRRSTTNTVNTTTALVFDFKAQHGAADIDNSITLTNIKITIEN